VRLGRPLVFAPLALLILAGCQSAQQRKAAETAATNKQAAEEITRICALQGAEREAELKRLKAASGLDLYCPN
jgi:outer membrane biogenesis lipoprotein LolB